MTNRQQLLHQPRGFDFTSSIGIILKFAGDRRRPFPSKFLLWIIQNSEWLSSWSTEWLVSEAACCHQILTYLNFWNTGIPVTRLIAIFQLLCSNLLSVQGFMGLQGDASETLTNRNVQAAATPQPPLQPPSSPPSHLSPGLPAWYICCKAGQWVQPRLQDPRKTKCRGSSWEYNFVIFCHVHLWTVSKKHTWMPCLEDLKLLVRSWRSIVSWNTAARPGWPLFHCTNPAVTSLH